MDTPICDFVQAYAESGRRRLHMPGHKGTGPLGIERLDITEINGADSLYAAEGIIARSEAAAGALFGARTFYSAEGCSHALRAMLLLACGEGGRVLAARNAHTAFVSAAALLGLEVEWLWPEQRQSYLSCTLSPQVLAARLEAGELPAAVYVTDPDYLGNRQDIAALAEVCHARGVLLLVDGAHGAYLKFLPRSAHPIDLGADMCANSAHKTLPVLTGGAYLHISRGLPPHYAENARQALALFGSTSPSYLILQSLDAANAALSQDYPAVLAALCRELDGLKAELREAGYELAGDEPMKLTLCPKSRGYRGDVLAQRLRAEGFECEYADADHLVFMPAPAAAADVCTLGDALLALPAGAPVRSAPPPFTRPEQVCSLRRAALSPCEQLPVRACEGRVLAQPNVACPPAVAPVMCGERIDAPACRLMEYYGITSCAVMRDI